jgi:hypothetical protein
LQHGRNLDFLGGEVGKRTTEVAPDIDSFAEFWPFYVREHSNKLNRVLHIIGSLLAYFGAIYLIVKGAYLYLPLCLICGYGFAWVGHFMVQKNVPATFKYPLWSFMGDQKMIYLSLTGRFDPELIAAFKK